MMLRKLVAITLVFTVALGGITYNGDKAQEVKAAQEWKLVWSDEFNGTKLDTNTWNYEIGNGNWGWGNGEWEYYTDREENVEVSNGTLKIKALKEDYGEQHYTSGRITTKGKKEFKYGKVEARIKLPSFKGAWPAFWTLGTNIGSVGWPKCGEIDIMEAINDENNTHGAIHWNVESAGYTGQGDNGVSSITRLPEGYQRTEWHTYGIIWNEKLIQWYIDDKVFFSHNITASHMSEFRMDHFILLNLAICGEWPGYVVDETAFPDKSIMEVDYVRIYEEAPIPEEPAVSTDDEVKVGKTKIKLAKKKSSKTVQISLKKVSGANGYRVKVSSTKNFKNSKTVTKDFRKIKFKISSKKFKNKKKLYIKARAYKKVDGEKIFGKWSNKKTLKVKKKLR